VVENRFLAADAGAAATQAITLRSASVLLRGNTWNGADRADLNPSPQNLLEVPDIFDSVRIPSGGEIVDSLLPASVATSAGQVSFLTVTAGGSGYTEASVVFIGAGLQAQATAMVYGGSVIGFRVTNNGSGYVAGATTCVINGNGSGAAATVQVGTPLQANRRIRLLAAAGVTLKQVGQTMTQANATARDLILVPETAVELVENGGTWLVSGFYPAALLQTAANGAVTLASPAGAALSLEPGSGGNLLAVNLPGSGSGLPAGAIWRNGNILSIV